MTLSTFLEKVDVTDIWREHVATFVDSRKVRRASDWLLFYVCPVAPVLVMAYFRVPLRQEAAGVLATALSVLAGLLFNLMVLLHSINIRKQDHPNYSLITRLFWELHSNIAYAIMVALLTLIPLVAATYCGDGITRLVLGTLVAYLSVHFVLTMGMVLKRTDAMLQLKKD